MCTSPHVRIPVSDFLSLSPIFQKKCVNGGLFFGSKNSELLDQFIRVHAALNGGEFPFEIQEIPCGQCMDCRIKHSQMWANRCMLEAQQYEHNYFITLTYDDDHLIDNVRYTVSRHSGELEFCAELVKEDFTKFKKRLLERIYEATGHRGVRFFMCGEYGSKNGRPHFHAILFNCPLPDLKLHSRANLNGRKYCYYSSDILNESWNKGHTMIGEMCWETAAYVARYVTKKFHSEEEKTYQAYCQAANVEPMQAEFVNMSRKPGIARNFYDEHKFDIYEYDQVIISNGRKSQPFRYYDKLFEIEAGAESLSDVKEERKRTAQLKHMIKYQGMSSSQIETAEAAAQAKKDAAYKKLKREL